MRNWPDDWPRKDNYVIQHDVTLNQYQGFKELVDTRASEKEIERFLMQNKEVLSLAIFMFSTGHHMSWIFPKEQIRVPSGDVGGLIPDYVMAGANSDGVQWFVLELKGADKEAFTKKGKQPSLSPEANKGVCQLLNYIDHSSRDQAYLRDTLGLKNFREPKGILLIGTDDETEDHVLQNFKGAWNRMNPNLKIRSYDALLRQVADKLRSFDRLK